MMAAMTRNKVSVLGVGIVNLSQEEAILLMESFLQDHGAARNIFIVNAHTLNLAKTNPEYSAVLKRANHVFADGTGARWAARLRGVRLKDNLVGTDLIPKLFDKTSGEGLRYFLLGANPGTVDRAAERCARAFAGWTLAGFHHGYINESESLEVVAKINAAKPNLLLVAMGNPLQENWIDRYKSQLTVPLCVGVGGLFDHWAGNLERAPAWIRRQGLEWLQILLQQPHKWRRYLIGNPMFIMRIIMDIPRDLAKTNKV